MNRVLRTLTLITYTDITVNTVQNYYETQQPRTNEGKLKKRIDVSE
jgi:hypothetical protein